MTSGLADSARGVLRHYLGLTVVGIAPQRSYRKLIAQLQRSPVYISWLDFAECAAHDQRAKKGVSVTHLPVRTRRSFARARDVSNGQATRGNVWCG